MRSEMEIAVFDGASLIQRCHCTIRDMPDGRPAAVWHGVLYPLLADDRIDVGAVDPAAPPAQPYTVITGADSTWILIQGLSGALADVQLRLEAAGIAVSRSGRWLGDMAGDVAFDWFLRCEGEVGSVRVAEVLGERPAVGDTAEARVAILEQHLLELRAALARLADQLAEATRAPPTASQEIKVDTPVRDTTLQAALEKVRELEARLDTVPPRAAPMKPAMVRLGDELGAALAALRPGVSLLRDSLQVAVGEFASRSAFYRLLQELPISGGRPEGWKALRGAERWWERHVSTGQDDSGRAYARFDPASRQWDLLLGWKGEQARDIDWLKRRA
jgi:hypothetical protein